MDSVAEGEADMESVQDASTKESGLSDDDDLIIDKGPETIKEPVADEQQIIAETTLIVGD